MYRRKTLGYTLYTILNSVEKCSWLVSIGKIGRFQYHIALDQLTISLFWKKMHWSTLNVLDESRSISEINLNRSDLR